MNIAKSKKAIIAIAAAIFLLCTGMWVYNNYFGKTKIAFINFRTIEMGTIARANNNGRIKIEVLGTDRLDKLGHYDMVFINGMGLRIVEQQRQILLDKAASGTKIYTSMATNPDNNICSLTDSEKETVASYLSNGGKRNYRNMLNYIRKEIDGKLGGNIPYEPAVEKNYDIIYHNDASGEELEFATVQEYEKWYEKTGLKKINGDRIVVTGQLADASELIRELEEKGFNVYPVLSIRKLFGFIEEIKPAAVINMAHGRLSDKFVEMLKNNNILYFTPLTVMTTKEEWEADNMGMSGGFLSQSVATPEIDGAILTYALFAEKEDEDGMRYSYAMPDRLESFTNTVSNYLKLRKKKNSEKKIAIVYYKGPGQNAMTASGMDVVGSMYNFLKRLQSEGYDISGLPENREALEKIIMEKGAVFNTYADGAIGQFINNASPQLVSRHEYERMCSESLPESLIRSVYETNGEFPGTYMAANDSSIAIARIRFGNVVLMPQQAAGGGDNAFEIVHGTGKTPSHNYIASYLWLQHGFKADALIHFGTHGSLEFTPQKQVALSSLDWPDRLVGEMPHFYIYSIGNVGEGIIAKRRSYATLQSYLTPPFLESGQDGKYGKIADLAEKYDKAVAEENMALAEKYAAGIAEAAKRLGLDRDLGIDTSSTAYTAEEIGKIGNFAMEIGTEKITGQLYTMGVPYEKERINSSVLAMCADPIAYSMYFLDKTRGKAENGLTEKKSLFAGRYLEPAKNLVKDQLEHPAKDIRQLICSYASISTAELLKAEKIQQMQQRPSGMEAMMQMMTASGSNAGKGQDKKAAEHGKSANGHPAMKTADGKSHPGKMAESMNKKMQNNGMPESGMPDKKELEYYNAINALAETVKNIENYRKALEESPEKEFTAILHSLDGGYTAPSPGGDIIANPNTLPTGRNLFSINAEATPSAKAWEKGVELAKSTIEMYRERHNGEYPRKVSYTLWSGEFIETEGATIAQILYMLGVEPVRDSYGRVSDLRLIPSEELGRPRIDIVVQTSGQLRDLAASRLFLINRAVSMAAAAGDEKYENSVSKGITEAEKLLVEKGLSPKQAREISAYRVFGGVNGSYGTGIQGMVTSGDRWESEDEIAKVYMNNMGAFYGSEKDWEKFVGYAFEAALTRTDAVVQPRQSNTWGALSLDHVYEFMGGLNLSVRNVTGKDPDAYLSDYRNRNHVRMQELKEAIGVESRSTLLNENFIREKMKGGASDAAVFAETVTNTYGWNVMKPDAIDDRLWNEIYDIYIKDSKNLGTTGFFEKNNPAALEEMSAVMLETARKGMWNATGEQIRTLAVLHTELVRKYRPSCSGFVCDNAKLREYIASSVDSRKAGEYRENIREIREKQVSGEKGTVLKKEQLNGETTMKKTEIRNTAILISALVVLSIITVYIRKRRYNS